MFSLVSPLASQRFRLAFPPSRGNAGFFRSFPPWRVLDFLFRPNGMAVPCSGRFVRSVHSRKSFFVVADVFVHATIAKTGRTSPHHSVLPKQLGFESPEEDEWKNAKRVSRELICKNGISASPVNCTCFEKVHLSFGFLSFRGAALPCISAKPQKK